MTWTDDDVEEKSLLSCIDDSTTCMAGPEKSCGISSDTFPPYENRKWPLTALSEDVKTCTAVDVRVVCPLGPTRETRKASDIPSPLSSMFDVLDPVRRLPNLSRASIVNPVSTPTTALDNPLSNPSSSSSTSVELTPCNSR